MLTVTFGVSMKPVSTLARKSAGFSLVELMIAMAVGLLILAGVFSLFGSTVQTQTRTLAMASLNQELRVAMDLMSRDIRRAGYWALAADGHTPEGTLTPGATSGSYVLFTSTNDAFQNFGAKIVGLKLLTSVGSATVTDYVDANSVRATVNTNFSSTSPIEQGRWIVGNPFSENTGNNVAVPSASCIVYSYDWDEDGVVDTDEHFGFRVNDGNLQMHTAGAIDSNCGESGTWTQVNTNNVTITSLEFTTANYNCLNITTGADCTAVAPATGDILLTEREVGITLSGRLASDSSVSRTLMESVRVRNDRLTVQ